LAGLVRRAPDGVAGAAASNEAGVALTVDLAHSERVADGFIGEVATIGAFDVLRDGAAARASGCELDATLEDALDTTRDTRLRKARWEGALSSGAWLMAASMSAGCTAACTRGLRDGARREAAGTR
jgi:hypothetical protein